jgi:CP family cyanate transporter-like MFS transporter
VWAIPAVLAVLAWAVLRPRQEAPKLAGATGGHWFGTRRAWLLALYFGLINGGYTSMVAWLPAYHTEHGGSARAVPIWWA